MTLPDLTFLDNDLRHWGLALAVTVATAGLLRLVKAIAVSRLGALAKRTATTVDDAVVDALRGTRVITLVAGGVAAGVTRLELEPGAEAVVMKIVLLVMILQVALWVMATTIGWLHRYRDRVLENDRGAATSVGAMSFLARLIIWSVAVLVALDSMNVDVTALITGLGIGGVAVALAMQNVLGDLFASLSIVLDKPFVIGDFLIVDTYMGAVEYVGLRTTRIRSLSGEQLVFSNSDLLKSRIRNYGRMIERRVVFRIGVTYGTPLEKLKIIPGIIKDAITEHDNTRFDRSHFATYGDWSLQYEAVYYVLAADYTMYMDVQQAINFRLRERFDAEGIEFAFPTQTLYVRGQGGAPDTTARPPGGRWRNDVLTAVLTVFENFHATLGPVFVRLGDDASPGAAPVGGHHGPRTPRPPPCPPRLLHPDRLGRRGRRRPGRRRLARHPAAVLEIGRAPGPIVLDGRLDDPGWRGAPVATHFAEHNPGDQVQPPFRTEAWLTYDDENVYAAFHCYDDPAAVRASFCKRDNIFQDDVVFLCLDTFGDGVTGYEIAVNPYGIQGDLFYSAAGGEDIRFDLVYHTAARITDDGWIAEFAVPLRSLRFPDRPEQVWRVDFWRNQPRDVRYQASWAAYDRDESCWPCQWGTVTGIRDVHPAAGVELIPAFTADQAGRARPATAASTTARCGASRP